VADNHVLSEVRTTQAHERRIAICEGCEPPQPIEGDSLGHGQGGRRLLGEARLTQAFHHELKVGRFLVGQDTPSVL